MPSYTGGKDCIISRQAAASSTSGQPHGVTHDPGGRAGSVAKVVRFHSDGRVIVRFADGEERDYHKSELEK